MKSLKLFTDNVAPHGFGYIVSDNETISRKRRVFWTLWVIICCGVLVNHVYLSMRRFLAYPSTIKITICPNGIHSRQMVTSLYPNVAKVLDTVHFGLNESTRLNSITSCKMRDIRYDEFLDETKSPLTITHCRYMGSDCTSKWLEVPTPFGRCLRIDSRTIELATQREDHHHHATNRGELLVTVDYQTADAFGGRNQFFDGLTVFYSALNEFYMERTKSVTISTGQQTPVLSFQHYHEELLGAPYSNCVSNGSLKFFEVYSYGNCVLECMRAKVIKKCSCAPDYLMFGNSEQVQQCSLHQMATCVSSYTLNEFEEAMECKCWPACTSSTPDIAFIQYANTQPRKNNRLSFIANRVNTLEITNQEVADYTSSQLIGDVGGAGGLFLGVSVGTLVGVFDCFALACASYCRRKMGRLMRRRINSISSYDQAVMEFGYKRLHNNKHAWL